MKQFVQDVSNLANNFEKLSKKQLQRLSEELLQDIKKRTPVDTGLLKQSWKGDCHKNILTIYNTQPYVGYVEYGHRTRGGKNFVQGQYMVKKAFDNIDQQIDDLFDEIVSEVF